MTHILAQKQLTADRWQRGGWTQTGNAAAARWKLYRGFLGHLGHALFNPLITLCFPVTQRWGAFWANRARQMQPDAFNAPNATRCIFLGPTTAGAYRGGH